MYQLDHILVCLDLSEMDDFLIRYSNFMVDNLQPKSITFMHVVKSYDIPKDIIAAFPDLDEPLTSVLKEELEEKVDQLFTGKEKVETIVSIEEGMTTETIIDYTRDHNITLTLMGKKIGYKGRGSVVRKVLSLSPSSVLLISETSQRKIDHIMLRMDFTKTSQMAMKMAQRVKDLTRATISAHYVYKIPLNYFPQHDMRNQAKLEQQVAKHSKKEFEKFMKKVELPKEEVPFSYSVDTENDEAYQLYHEALNKGADLILIGSKIKSGLADIIVDSTSEKLAEGEKNIPIFVVKDRKQTLGFLEALFD